MNEKKIIVIVLFLMFFYYLYVRLAHRRAAFQKLSHILPESQIAGIFKSLFSDIPALTAKYKGNRLEISWSKGAEGESDYLSFKILAELKKNIDVEINALKDKGPLSVFLKTKNLAILPTELEEFIYVEGNGNEELLKKIFGCSGVQNSLKYLVVDKQQLVVKNQFIVLNQLVYPQRQNFFKDLDPSRVSKILDNLIVFLKEVDQCE